MLTKNYKLYRKGRFRNEVKDGLVNFAGTGFSYYPANTAGTANTGDFGQAMKAAKASVPEIAGTINYGVYFGSGATAATEDDYTLETFITSGLTFSSPVYEESDDLSWAKSSWVVTNSTDSDITIREIGAFSAIPHTGNTNTAYTTLIERTVLSEPIVIPAHGAKAITYYVEGI